MCPHEHYGVFMRVKTPLFIILCLVLFLSIGCFPKGNQTTRPNIDISPWTEQRIKSPQSGTVYDYMFIAGPTEDAQSVVLLHGGIFDNRIWLYCHSLSKKYNVYAPRFPSNSLFYNGHLSNWGEVVNDFIQTTQIKPSLLIGVSNGAYGAIGYLNNYPKNPVKGLVLISTIMVSSSEDEIKKRSRKARFALNLSPFKLKGLINKRAQNNDYPKAPGKIQHIDIFYVRPYSYYYQLFSAPYNLGSKKQNTKDIKIPVLVLHGSEDDIMPIQYANDTLDAFPNATFKEFKGQGHSMVFTIGPKIARTIIKHFNK